MASRLDTVVNVATLVTLIGICVTLLHISRTAQPQRGPEPYRVGDRLASIENSEFEKATKTLFVFLRNGCSYCAASMPFYKAVAETRKTSPPATIRVVAVVLAERDKQTAVLYLKQNGLEFDDALILSPEQARNTRVRGTPTLILTDQSGRIVQQWIGRLERAQEEDVIAAAFRD